MPLSAHFVEQLGAEFGTGTAERMAEGDGPSIGVDLFGVEPGFLYDRERLGSEGFVEFDLVNVA
jgi:hypothetical protein